MELILIEFHRLNCVFCYICIADVVSLRSALIYDAVMVFAMAIQQLGTDQVTPITVLCNEAGSTWNKGYTIINYMKNVIQIDSFSLSD